MTSALPSAGAAVSWVPVSPLRRFVRGYDQSRLLAQALGELLGLPVYPVLRKRRHTPKQVYGIPGSKYPSPKYTTASPLPS